MIGFLWVFGFSFYVVASIGPSLWLAGSSVWVLVERWVSARRRSQAVFATRCGGPKRDVH